MCDSDQSSGSNRCLSVGVAHCTAVPSWGGESYISWPMKVSQSTHSTWHLLNKSETLLGLRPAVYLHPLRYQPRLFIQLLETVL